MKLEKIAKKYIAICTVILLTFSFNFSINVSAEIIPDYDYGIAYDDFENNADVNLKNCNLSDGSIKLTDEPYNITYNHSQTPDKISAFKTIKNLFAPGDEDFLQIFSTFINPKLLEETEFELSDYQKLNARDGNAAITNSLYGHHLDYTYFPMNLFRFQISEDKSLIQDFQATWYSGPYDPDANLEEIAMFVWSYGDLLPRWTSVGSIIYSEESINAPNGSISDIISSDFIGKSGEIDILIVGTPGPEQRTNLSSDFIEVKLITTGGKYYAKDGNVTSNPIIPDPSKFGGWESVFWEGSRSGSTSYIKLQILDSAGNVIEALDGNLEGFDSSPIDLSSLGKTYSQIRLRANLHTENSQYTPRLDSWGALWQARDDGFYDNFAKDYRISKYYGVDVEEENVKISDFYSDWPIFGKSPDNTRSYVGIGTTKDSNKTYWHTELDTNMGGWFHSPIVSNGKVYVSCSDNRIYAFNLTADSSSEFYKDQYPFDVSDTNYTVESSVACSGDILIVATSELDSDTNRVYALNSSDLSEVLWSYELDSSDTICYSAAPTIANGKVYVTSWSGKFSYAPVVYYLYSKLNSKLGSILGANNKIIALDLATGSELWSKDLPAGSLSTPAVDDSLVFVGCENSDGSSLFALDENTGDGVWNASIGAIGRASPVVTDGADGKIVIALSREQNLLSSKGTDKVFALDAETGKALWNKTLGNESTALRNIILRGLGFDNLIATTEPAATPASIGSTVFVMSQNGTLFALDVDSGDEKWTFDSPKGALNMLSSFYAASPAVVDNTVYVSTEDGRVYALDNLRNGETVLEYPVEYTGLAYPLSLNFYSSPTVTDGLVTVSATEWLAAGTMGHLMCLGDYTTNSIGTIYSVPIHVQKGKWWSKLDVVNSTTAENIIEYSILDSEGNPLKEGLKQKSNDISNINTDTIQLYARLSITNTSQLPPVLQSWSVLWSSETTAPVFKSSTFEPDPTGWISNNTPVCKIKVYDGFPGLNVESAKYRVTYNNSQVSEWFDAECSGVNGTKSNETITADLSKADLNKNLDLKYIEFSIKDLSGNENTSKLADAFKLDKLKPESWINNTLAYYNNEKVDIKANASDPGDTGNKSGIKSIALYYRLEDESTWSNFGSDLSPFEWNFENDTSGIYEICTIATDKAGNVEDPKEAQESFLFDKNPPAKPEFKEDYSFKSLPEFSIEFIDDYALETVEYKLEFGSWIQINRDDINSQSYTGTWKLSQEDWDYMIDEETNYMYFRLTDICGNQYETPSDEEALNITKDAIPPSSDISLDLSEFSEGSWKDTYVITADIPDDEDIEGIALEYRYSSDNQNWGEWTQYGQNLELGDNFEWEFTADEGTGYYEFKVKIWDSADNVVESAVGAASVALFPTALVAIMIALILILLIATVVIIKRMRKKTQ